MADVTKITLPDGTTKNIKDATAREQANWNTNNGVKNFATINNFSHTGYNKDVPVDGSLTGNVVVYIGNIISTDTDANQCAVLFMYTDGTSSQIHLVNRGTASSFSENLGAKVLKSVRIYSSDTYGHSYDDTVTVTNLMVCPKFLYDADSTYEPYALSNSELTAKEQTNETNISNIQTCVKTIIFTIRPKVITLPQPVNFVILAYGFIQGVGMVAWTINYAAANTIEIKDIYTGATIVQDATKYSITLDSTNSTLTFATTVFQSSNLMLLIPNTSVN